jgi:hypothetical protein
MVARSILYRRKVYHDVLAADVEESGCQKHMGTRGFYFVRGSRRGASTSRPSPDKSCASSWKYLTV